MNILVSIMQCGSRHAQEASEVDDKQLSLTISDSSGTRTAIPYRERESVWSQVSSREREGV